MNAHDGPQQGTDERDQSVKDGNCAGYNPGYDCDAEGAGEPGYPVRGGVAAEMARVAECVDEDEFCRDLYTQATIRDVLILLIFSGLTYMCDNGHAND